MDKSELKTAAAYIRVSTDNQTELSPDSQIKLVRQYAKQHGYIIPKEFIFRDDGISGRHADKRPQFNEMIATAKQKPSPFSAVLLWKFSRFARNQEESIFYKSMLRKNGVEVLSVSEPIVDGPFGMLIERIIEWSDEYYSIRLSGEVKRGMTEKVERGGVVSIPSFGYSIRDKKYIVNPETAPIVRKIFSDFLNGVPSIQIARNLNDLKIKTTRGNVWENRTIDYVLQNPVYIGKIRWNPKHKTCRNFDDPDIVIVDGQHEPIIDEKTFNDVQKIFEENRRKYTRYTHHQSADEYMLHGLLKCSNCGASLSLAVKNQSVQCVKYTHGQCNVSHSINLNKLNEMVLLTIEQAFKTGNFNVKIKDNGINKTNLDVDTLIEKENLKMKRVRDAYEDGIYTLEEFKESKKAIDEQIRRLSALSAKSKAKADENELKSRMIDKNKNVMKTLRNPKVSEKEKNELLKTFVEKIVFNRPKSEIEIFFYV